MKLLLVLAVIGVAARGIVGAAITEKPIMADQGPKDQENTPGAFQGDMMLTDEQRTDIMQAIEDQKAGRQKRKAILSESYRWPLDIVPYEITESSAADTDIIRAAMDHWETHTCLTFEPRTSSHSSQLGHGAYLSFFKGGGCWSYVGMAFSAEQQISIGNGCAYLGTVAHEIGHAIGFHHEQSRPDRDDYVVVHVENIISGYEDNFDKYTVSYVTTGDVGYDVGSVMHYGAYAFSSNGKPTITTVDPFEMGMLGNREGLSFADIKLANIIYECNADCSSSLACENDGYQGPDCTCVCPLGFTGNLCQDEGGPTEAPICAETLTASTGEFTSPNHPSVYDNNANCFYLIEGATGSTITLTFLDIDIEFHTSCNYDAVEVRVTDISLPGESFCGTTLPPVQTSTGNQMLVVFRSDYSVGGSGFRASYVINGAVTTPATTTTAATTTTVATTTVSTTTAPVFVGTCGGRFGGSGGTMASPNYPSDYGNNLDCLYTIEVAEGYRIELTIVDFLLQNHRKCNKDRLEITPGNGIVLPMRLCGSTYPTGSLGSTDNTMTIKFKSNKTGTKKGFAASYRAVPI